MTKKEHTGPATPSLDEANEMLRRAARPRLASEERRLQKISWIMSTQGENGLTRQQVEELVDEL